MAAQHHRPGSGGWLQQWRRMRLSTHLLLILICLFVGLPFLYALNVSTLTQAEAFQYPPRITPGGDFIDNVQALFDPNRQDFGRKFFNTFVVSVIVVLGKTLTSMTAGLAFVYFRFPGKWILFFFVLFTLLMPTEIIIVPLFRLMRDLTDQFAAWNMEEVRWSDSKLSLTVPFLASATGAFLFRQHFSNIPRELLEAAQLDGASPIKFMFSVLLPMSWNVIGAMTVIQFLYMWNQYIWPELIIQDSREALIQQGVVNTITVGAQVDYGLLMAAAVVTSIPPVLVFVLLQRQFMSGFALTRDK